MYEMKFLKFDIWNKNSEIRYMKWNFLILIYEMKFLKFDTWNKISEIWCMK